MLSSTRRKCVTHESNNRKIVIKTIDSKVYPNSGSAGLLCVASFLCLAMQDINRTVIVSHNNVWTVYYWYRIGAESKVASQNQLEYRASILLFYFVPSTIKSISGLLEIRNGLPLVVCTNPEKCSSEFSFIYATLFLANFLST